MPLSFPLYTGGQNWWTLHFQKFLSHSMRTYRSLFLFFMWSQTQPNILFSRSGCQNRHFEMSCAHCNNAWLCLASHSKAKHNQASSCDISKRLLGAFFDICFPKINRVFPGCPRAPQGAPGIPREPQGFPGILRETRRPPGQPCTFLEIPRVISGMS